MDKIEKKAYLKKIEETIKNGRYKDDWDSLQNINVPKWYTDGKFGIFSHWGVYSVPAFGNEWYPRAMYQKDSKEFLHHVATYGEHKDFGYKDFVPQFKAENFDADEWLDLFYASGAKFIVPVAEHHDGFMMYKSNISHWNAYEMGPKRDIVGELKAAAEKRDIRLGVSSHRIEHWWFMNGGKTFDSDMQQELKEGDLYWPAMPESEDLGGRRPKNFMSPEHKKISVQFAEDWLVRCCELVDSYKPATVFFDWWIQVEPLKPYLKKFAAYYYNKMEEWGKIGIIHYKFDAMAFKTGVLDIERGQSGYLRAYPWQTDTAIARNSWGYTENNNFKGAPEILRDFVDIISKNGCLLLNIGPRADGTITDEEKKVLRQIGGWLAQNGEAVYGTSPFRVFGEGPTEVSEGGFTDGAEKKFTEKDIRFTHKGSNLYAIVQSYPENGVVNIKSLGNKSSVFSGFVKDVSVLGFEEKPEYQSSDDGLLIKTKSIKSENPVAFRIKID